MHDSPTNVEFLSRIAAATPLCLYDTDWLGLGNNFNVTGSRPYMHVGAEYRSFSRVIFVALHGDESSPLHWVVPFNRTGYNRHVPGTAHRPFPTVSLQRSTSAPIVSIM